MYEYCGPQTDLSESQISFKFRLSSYYADRFDETEIQSPEKQQIADWERKVKSLEEIHNVAKVEPWMIVPIQNTSPSNDAMLRLVDPELECNSTMETIDSVRENSSPINTSDSLELRYRRPSIKDLAMRQSSRTSMLQTRTSMLGSRNLKSARTSIQGSRGSISVHSLRSSIQSLQSPSAELTLERKPSAIDRLSKKFADSSLSLTSLSSPKEMTSMPIPIDLGDELPSIEERKHARTSMIQKKASRNSMLSSLSAISNLDSSAKNSFGSTVSAMVDKTEIAATGIEETLEALVTVKRSKKAAEAAAAEAKLREVEKIADNIDQSRKSSVTDASGFNGLLPNDEIYIDNNDATRISSASEAKRSKTKFLSSLTKQKPTAEEIRNHRLHR